MNTFAETYATLEHKNIKVKLSSFCKKPSKDRLISLLESFKTKEENTCRLNYLNFDQVFYYNRAAAQWVHQTQSAENECGNMELSILKNVNRDGEIKSNSWVYSRRISVLNVNGNSGIIPCRNLQQELYYNSPLDSKHTFTEINCKYIDLGNHISDFTSKS